MLITAEILSNAYIHEAREPERWAIYMYIYIFFHSCRINWIAARGVYQPYIYPTYIHLTASEE